LEAPVVPLARYPVGLMGAFAEGSSAISGREKPWQRWVLERSCAYIHKSPHNSRGCRCRKSRYPGAAVMEFNRLRGGLRGRCHPQPAPTGRAADAMTANLTVKGAIGATEPRSFNGLRLQLTMWLTFGPGNARNGRSNRARLSTRYCLPVYVSTQQHSIIYTRTRGADRRDARLVEAIGQQFMTYINGTACAARPYLTARLRTREGQGAHNRGITTMRSG
jgi:hypothetical protein